jgi:hypothetical protein
MIKKQSTQLKWLMFCGVLLSGMSLTSNADTVAKGSVISKSENEAVAVYRPPFRGAPKTRVGAGVRGAGNKAMLHIIAPEHTGLTLKAQPSLYWYSEEILKPRLEFALIDDNAIEPMLELDLKSKSSRGLNHIDLAKHGIKLKPGVEYQWSVAAVYDDRKRSSDIVASGTIKRISLEHDLEKKLSEQKGVQRISLLLKNGIWYDAFDELSVLLSEQQNNREFKLARNSMLDQVGLSSVIKRLE